MSQIQIVSVTPLEKGKREILLGNGITFSLYSGECRKYGIKEEGYLEEEAYQKIAGTFLKKAMAGEDIYLRGDGSAVRHMVYVDDLCREIIRILKQAPKPDSGSHTLDIVNETPVTIRELADWAVEMTGSNSQIILEFKKDDKAHKQQQCNMITKYAQSIYFLKKKTSYREGMQQLYHYLKEQS